MQLMATMMANTTIRSTPQTIRVALVSFISLSISWLLVLLLLRTGEWLLNGWTHQFPGKAFSFLLLTCFADLIFFCKISLFLLLLFLALSFISLKIARGVYITIVVLVTIGYLSLVQYFNSTLVPLGADLYSYTWKEIQQTVGASGKLNAWTILIMIVLIAFVVAAIVRISRRIKTTPNLTYALIIVIVTGGLLSLGSFMPPPSFQNEYDNNLAHNKLDYFLHASCDHFFPTLQEVDIYADAYIGDYGDGSGSGNIASFNYVDEKNFPFLHTDSTPDVLAPFLNKAPAPPNIVILLVEGLGRAFTGPGAYLGNFTPFVDSLSRHSLYWENFLSGGGRTFAVLPTLLGSLPFGKNGFNETGDQMPPHLSLVSLLKKNGYHTSFYYGGEASFDKMELFLQKQSIDQVFDKKTFPAGYAQLPANNGFTWGYGDKELFRYFFSKQEQRNRQQPALQILLTVATHSPFLVNEQSFYQQAFEQRMNTLGFTEEQKKEHRQYALQYASVLFADDALKNFFQQYSKRAEFSNTIFLITGDHRMPEIPMISRIDRYHVPLILYSPLLQRTARFQSVSTHFDITPTLLSYLKNNHGIKTPALVSWLGSGIDTARNLRNIHALPLMQTKTDLVDFVMGNVHLNGSDVFRINNTLNEEKVTEENTKESIQGAFARFQQKNTQFIQGAPLLPDSVYKAWHP